MKRPLALVAALSSLFLSSGESAAGLTLSGELLPGVAVLLTVPDVPPGAQLTGQLDDTPFPLTAAGQALIALDMDAPPGERRLTVTVRPRDGEARLHQARIPVKKRTYKEERLTLPENKVDLSSPDLARAEAETATIQKAFAARTDTPYYAQGFRLPVAGRFSGFFGSRRILNGKPRSPHNGIDIRAAQGTPIIATAPGRVALVGQDYFFTGNTIVLDHGHGVFSLYSHLEKMEARAGEMVAEGGRIGTVGATGRASGPHLHWGFRVREARVDASRLPGIVAP